MAEVLYRMDIRYNQVKIIKYTVLSKTKCGVWIHHDFKRKFVNLECRKQFASRTKEEAVQGFLARKRRHAGILQHQLDVINKAVELVKSGKYKDTDILDALGFQLL